MRRLASTDAPEKAMQGTPWYTVLSNKHYSEQFMFIGSFVAEREKLIENGEPEDTPMTERQKTLKLEQSDMVLILMNLAVIPDEVVQKIKFVPGW